MPAGPASRITPPDRLVTTRFTTAVARANSRSRPISGCTSCSFSQALDAQNTLLFSGHMDIKNSVSELSLQRVVVPADALLRGQGEAVHKSGSEHGGRNGGAEVELGRAVVAHGCRGCGWRRGIDPRHERGPTGIDHTRTRRDRDRAVR